MYAITMDAPGGADALRWTERPDPVAGGGQVLIDVAAAGVNFRDIYFRRGMYPAPPGYVPGQEAAGTIIALGDNVAGLAVGDRVVAMLPSGAYAERVVAPATMVAKIPDGITFEDAAAIELQGLTAHAITTSCTTIRPGEWVVVHAAAGGLGLLLTQIAKAKGAHVIGTVSNASKVSISHAAGADFVVGYDDFLSVAREQTGGHGVDAVFDGVGADTYQNSLAALTPTGTLVLFGWVSGTVASIDLDLMRSRRFVRPRLNEYLLGPEYARRIAAVFAWMQDGVVKPTIGARFAMRDAGRAQDALDSRQVLGKVMLLRELESASPAPASKGPPNAG